MKIVPFDAGELKKVGITLIPAKPRHLLRCDVCGETWEYPGAGVVPPDYWHCPTWGCNITIEEVLRK